MGISHSFHHLDTVAFARALEFVGMRDELPIGEVRALLASFDRDRPEQFESSSWDEVEHEILTGDAASMRWRAVLAAAQRASWCIDKAHDRPAGGFTELFGREPSLEPVARLFRSGEKLPASIKGAEELTQIVSPSALVVVRDAMAPWLDRERIATAKPTLLGRVVGPRDFAEEWRNDDYLWNHWRELNEAVTTCASAGEALAVTWG